MSVNISEERVSGTVCQVTSVHKLVSETICMSINISVERVSGTIFLSYLIYPVVWLTVGAPLLILQPASSTPLGSQLSVVRCSIEGQSTL